MSYSSENISDQNQERVDKILEVVMAYASLDFTKKTEVLGNNDVLDAIGAGINMLGEELENSTVSLKEKEQLLKEVHHRVKNNLQIVSSLLNLQSSNILDEKYLDLITDSRNRINSMAIVHEMLYAAKDLSKIEIGEYIRRLGNSIHQSFSKPGSDVKFNFNIEQNLFFDVDHMIPIGLIINEIVSNSFKYAFPGNNGQINIDLNRYESGYYLSIQDNGIGLSEDFNPEKDGHLGMQLILMLSQQMEGKITIRRQQQGTAYTISFPY
jgi:two-component sensor histidine kinase